MKNKRNLVLGVSAIFMIFALSSCTSTKEIEKPKTTKVESLKKKGEYSNVKVEVLSNETRKQIGDDFLAENSIGIFKILRVRVSNNRNDEIIADTSNFKLIDNKNRVFSCSNMMATSSKYTKSEEILFLKPINPGLTVSSYLIFDIPEDAKGLYLKVTHDLFGDIMNISIN